MKENEISSLESHKWPGYVKAKDTKKEGQREGSLSLCLTSKVPAEMKLLITFTCLSVTTQSLITEGTPWTVDIIHAHI